MKTETHRESTPRRDPTGYYGRDRWLSGLHLVTAAELENLREAVSHSRVPLDLQAKLATLAGPNLRHRFIQQQSQLFLALLLATADGSYKGATWAQLEQLLRVLAYVRKDDDVIYDNLSGGYVDDHEEVRAATLQLQTLLDDFKRWRLRHQVPLLWLRLCAEPGNCKTVERKQAGGASH